MVREFGLGDGLPFLNACYNYHIYLREGLHFNLLFTCMREEKLLLLLKRKKGFFEAILELSEEEIDLPLHEWISSLEQKKILLSCIEEIDAELMPFKKNLNMISQEISEELECIRTVIKKILHLDAVNQEKRKKELRPQDKRLG